MHILLKFKNIVDSPNCKILLNDLECYCGPVIEDVVVDNENPMSGAQCLKIIHWGKEPTDTIVVDGKIVRDRSFELASIVVDGYDVEELIWQSHYEAVDGQVFNSCLFFGPNGQFVFNFSSPILEYILRTRHALNNNDPNWKEDYELYMRACKLLQQIST